jgi:hypothetical protein
VGQGPLVGVEQAGGGGLREQARRRLAGPTALDVALLPPAQERRPLDLGHHARAADGDGVGPWVVLGVDPGHRLEEAQHGLADQVVGLDNVPLPLAALAEAIRIKHQRLLEFGTDRQSSGRTLVGGP